MIPKSVHQERIISNFDVFDFELSEEQMAKILALNDPDNYPFMDAESAYDRWSARLRGEETFPPRR